MDVADLQCCPF